MVVDMRRRFYRKFVTLPKPSLTKTASPTTCRANGGRASSLADHDLWDRGLTAHAGLDRADGEKAARQWRR